MPDDFEIGRVTAVDTAQITVQLNKDTNALSRTTYEGVLDVGKINSYVIIPVGVERIVGIVTRILLAEETSPQTDHKTLTLPTTNKIMKATLIGTLDSQMFTQGISAFPILDTPVYLATASDLDLIFDNINQADTPPHHDDPGFCLEIGKSAIFNEYMIRVDPDAFFGKHAAILGSTGSGKSCTIASLIQSVLKRAEVRRSNFIILDTNGEYRSAFQQQNESGQQTNSGNYSTLYIPTDPSEENRLAVPYWFLNADDFVRLFRASKSVQRPVLLEALRLSRNRGSEQTNEQILRDDIVLEINRILASSTKNEKTSKDVRKLAKGLLERIGEESFTEAWSELPSEVTKEVVTSALKCVISEAEKHIDGVYPGIIPADSRAIIKSKIEPIYKVLTGVRIGEMHNPTGLTADTPAFFHKTEFRTRHIEQVLQREESGGARARDFSGTMLLRIDRLLSDKRFEFILGPTKGEFPNPKHSLATFLRDILGMSSCEKPSEKLSDHENVPLGILPFYDRQRKTTDEHNVVILDLSLLATEVLENVTALIGRLILEFLQRLGEPSSSVARGSFPVVLVLDEAQNYIGQSNRSEEEESISRIVFERIAREGRKYGLGLVVASQRPSELSRTVLSQCSSFIVHRLQNPEDIRYFKDIVPSIYSPLLDQLPALSPQTALVLGEAVRAPSLVRIKETHPLPRSHDPRFYKYWAQETCPSPNVESICALWESK